MSQIKYHRVYFILLILIIKEAITDDHEHNLNHDEHHDHDERDLHGIHHGMRQFDHNHHDEPHFQSLAHHPDLHYPDHTLHHNVFHANPDDHHNITAHDHHEEDHDHVNVTQADHKMNVHDAKPHHDMEHGGTGTSHTGKKPSETNQKQKKQQTEKPGKKAKDVHEHKDHDDHENHDDHEHHDDHENHDDHDHHEQDEKSRLKDFHKLRKSIQHDLKDKGKHELSAKEKAEREKWRQHQREYLWKMAHRTHKETGIPLHKLLPDLYTNHINRGVDALHQQYTLLLHSGRNCYHQKVKAGSIITVYYMDKNGEAVRVTALDNQAKMLREITSNSTGTIILSAQYDGMYHFCFDNPKWSPKKVFVSFQVTPGKVKRRKYWQYSQEGRIFVITELSQQIDALLQFYKAKWGLKDYQQTQYVRYMNQRAWCLLALALFIYAAQVYAIHRVFDRAYRGAMNSVQYRMAAKV